MKVTIITINRNNSQGLLKTIESVLMQDYTDLEYIIIDGGSSDNSIDVVKSFTDTPPGNYKMTGGNPGINFWISEPDNGIYNAMNKGIEQAHGEYLQFLNSGDQLANRLVTKNMIEGFESYSIIYGNIIKQISRREIFRSKAVDIDSFYTFFRGSFNHSASYIRMEIFNKYGRYDESLRIVSDWKLFLIAIALNNEPTLYKNHDVSLFDMNGTSNRNPALIKLEREKVLKELLPRTVYNDYLIYSDTIAHARRIKHYNLQIISRVFQRIIFQLEKLETKIKREQIVN